ncbi:HlyD family efflux transporter periplasmic adaptor subunit [Sphingomonas gilva]|uniref:HlyD family efflux transporter periplasmic adaptor subunit n=1 Tax=Sphingomonas gilva TaxID=2305907 RepID=A0A396RR07_9SPHN|nr:HlyD family efflux transporter periplasmic adaptor subunit [Sphingomonas gilva]RHW19064.1 HlyD family efflux transporter periplasmic adaptor subunit [Sphingomonas gilva]
MADIVERLTRAARRPSDAQLAAALIAVLAAMLAWLLLAGEPSEGAPAAGGEQSLTIARRPFTANLAFAGSIVPGDAIGVTAPFDGSVTAIGFTYGDRVEAGQMIVELDPGELMQTRNDAESAYLKAAQSAQEMANWTDGPEVSRARRAATSAALELNAAERDFRETKRLLDRGLVPRNEYDGAAQRLKTQRMAVASANEELQSTLRRGQGANRRVAALTLDSARAQLARLDGQLRRAVVRAPEAGVIVRPPAIQADGITSGVHVGARVSRGQMIGSIARDGGLAVAFKLDEGDVNQLEVDQPVVVTGPGFQGTALTGKIVSIAGEAVAAAGNSGKASFTATALLDPLKPEQAALVRIGMSAAVIVTTYNNPDAIVVPPLAVQGAAPAATVLVRPPGGGEPRAVPVRIGRVTPEGVEIVAGLKPGDEVIWTPPAPAAAPPA